MNKRLILQPYIFVLIIFLGSCSKKVLNVSENLVIFPAPPDTTRIQFLTSFSNSENIEGKRNSFAQFILGKSQVQEINKPYGISINKGKIYICDAFIKGIEIIDLNKKTYSIFVPGGKGQLKLPINCSIDDNGNLFIADVERKQIVVFDQKGSYVNSFGDAENFKPTDIAVFDNKVWVVNMVSHKINVYSNDLENKLLYSFPDVEQGGEGFLFSPTNITVSADKVYVTDFGDFKIKTYSKDGKYIESLGSYGKNIGQFVRPKGLAVDKESNLYVVDAGFENVQIFNKENKILMFFGGSYKGPGYMYLPAKVIVDYDNLSYFEKYVDPSYKLKYLVFVTNQYGPDKVNVYGHVEPK